MKKYLIFAILLIVGTVSAQTYKEVYQDIQALELKKAETQSKIDNSKYLKIIAEIDSEKKALESQLSFSVPVNDNQIFAWMESVIFTITPDGRIKITAKSSTAELKGGISNTLGANMEMLVYSPTWYEIYQTISVDDMQKLFDWLKIMGIVK